MFYSMTGYGITKIILDEINIIIELQTLNSKTTDINIKLPVDYQNKVILIKKLLKNKLHRGKIDLLIKFEPLNGEQQILNFNKEKFKNYFLHIKNLKNELNLSTSDNDIFTLLFQIRDVLEKNNTNSDENFWPKIDIGIKNVIEDVIEFRKQEGQGIKQFILDEISNIEKLILGIEPLEKERNKLLNERLKCSIKSNNVNYNENRFEQELIYYLEKLNITEEKKRLQNHCQYLREICTNNENIKGKKIGFIIQEINREINTLGAKAQFAEIQKLVVMMKNHNEQIKEQINNIL